MKKIKKNLLLPLLAVVIAVGSAFASQVKTTDNTLVQWGYYKTHTPCDTAVLCGSSGIPGCLAPNGQEAKGMTGTNICQQPLFRLN